MAKRKVSPAVMRLLGECAGLSSSERADLILLLGQQGAVPEHLHYLVQQLRDMNLWLPNYGTLSPGARKDVDQICFALGQMKGTSSGERDTHFVALVGVLLRQTRALIEARGGIANATSILSVLTTEPWGKLLDRAFPGYPKTMIGAILCGAALTGSQSSKSTE